VRTRLPSGVLAFAVPVLTACTPGSATVAAQPSTEPAAASGPSVHRPWTQMTRGERIDFMITTVLPKMKAELAAFDGKRFARVDCATCHGDSAARGEFSLPNPRLPALSEADDFARHRKLTPEMTTFMLERMEPDMAALLGLQPFDRTTRLGFGCFDCHKQARAPEAAPPRPPAP